MQKVLNHQDMQRVRAAILEFGEENNLTGRFGEGLENNRLVHYISERTGIDITEGDFGDVSLSERALGRSLGIDAQSLCNFVRFDKERLERSEKLFCVDLETLMKTLQVLYQEH